MRTEPDADLEPVADPDGERHWVVGWGYHLTGARVQKYFNYSSR